MYHRRYQRRSGSVSGSSPGRGMAGAGRAFTHEVQVPDRVAAHRESLRQRHEEAQIRQQLLETEQELDGILEEEKELARRREELQILNERQTEFHDRRLEVEDRLNQALLEFERASRQCARDVHSLEEALQTCRRYREELEGLAPGRVTAPRSETGLRRQLEFISDLERRLDAELSGLDEGEAGESRGTRGGAPVGFSDSLQRGVRFFLPFIGVGTVGLLLFLSLTGGGK